MQLCPNRATEVHLRSGETAFTDALKAFVLLENSLLFALSPVLTPEYNPEKERPSRRETLFFKLRRKYIQTTRKALKEKHGLQG